MRKLSIEIDKTLKFIAHNPNMFPKSDFNEIRKVVVKKFNTMYYRTNNIRLKFYLFSQTEKTQKIEKYKSIKRVS